MRVFLTVNPRLIDGARFQTVRSIVSGLNGICDLVVVPLDRIDFAARRVEGFRRAYRGRFESMGVISPAGGLWINYTDGFYLDWASLGFSSPGAFLKAQHDFYGEMIERGRFARLINTVAAERATLKLWLAGLDAARYKVIPSHRVESGQETAMEDQLDSLVTRYGSLVVKPNWGGASQEVVLLETREQVRRFAAQKRISKRRAHPLDTLCVQPRVEGAEKRLWFVGSECVDGRIIYRRPLPWDPYEARSKRIARYYFAPSTERIPSSSRRRGVGGGKQEIKAVAGKRAPTTLEQQFKADLETANSLWRRAGLEIGSVDFIGDQVNELNGCGTTFTQYNGWRCIADARPHLVQWLRQEVACLAH